MDRIAERSIQEQHLATGEAFEASLTSAGIKNTVSTTYGRPTGQTDCDSLLCIPTAIYAFPGVPTRCGSDQRTTASPLCELGWKSLGVLELTAAQHRKRMDTGPSDAYWWRWRSLYLCY